MFFPGHPTNREGASRPVGSSHHCRSINPAVGQAPIQPCASRPFQTCSPSPTTWAPAPQARVLSFPCPIFTQLPYLGCCVFQIEPRCCSVFELRDTGWIGIGLGWNLIGVARLVGWGGGLGSHPGYTRGAVPNHTGACGPSVHLPSACAVGVPFPLAFGWKCQYATLWGEMCGR